MIYIDGIIHILKKLEVLNVQRLKEWAVILLFLVLALVIAFMTRGGTTRVYSGTTDVATEFANFKTIDGEEYLVYNLKTRVIYYMFSTVASDNHAGYGFSYFAPYISENGNLCRYIDGNIVEIKAEIYH